MRRQRNSNATVENSSSVSAIGIRERWRGRQLYRPLVTVLIILLVTAVLSIYTLHLHKVVQQGRHLQPTQRDLPQQQPQQESTVAAEKQSKGSNMTLGAIVLLAPARDCVFDSSEIFRVCLIQNAIRSIDEHLNAHYGPYPIYVVLPSDPEEAATSNNVTITSKPRCNHWMACCDIDRPYTAADREELSRGLKHSRVHFVEVPMYSGEALEPGYSPEKFSRWRKGEDGSVKGFRKVGYLSMCRLYSGRLQQMSFLSQYKYYMRMDDDSLLINRMPFDPFVKMEEENLLYAYKRQATDLWGINIMWELTQKHMGAEQYKNMAKMGFLKKGDGRSRWLDRIHKTGKPLGLLTGNQVGGKEWTYQGHQPYNNFHISAVSIWLDPRWLAWEKDADEIHGFTKYHWGDANVHAMALGVLLQPQQVTRWPDLPYRHNTNDMGKEYPKPEWKEQCRFHHNLSSAV